MLNPKHFSALILGLSLCFGLTALDPILGYSAIKHRGLERTVTVKGVPEREYPADIVNWTIGFTLANNSLTQLHTSLQNSVESLRQYLVAQTMAGEEISSTTPIIHDSLTNQYRNTDNNAPRYTGSQSVTVYSNNVDLIREVIQEFTAAKQFRMREVGGAGRSSSSIL